MELNNKSIRNILTVRYDPLEKPLFPPLTWKDLDYNLNDKDGIKTEKLLTGSIIKNLSKEKSISISLSSGIDSSLCLGLIRKIFPEKKITGICGVFGKSFDESIVAEKIARKFNADFLTVNMESIFHQLPEIISITKKPKWNTYIHLIAKKAKKISNNIVTGDGADELFGGYTFRYEKFQNSFNQNGTWKDKVKNYLECHNRDWVNDQEQMFGKKIKFDWNEIYEYFRPFFQNKLDPLKQVMLADYNGKLLRDFIPLGKSICSYYKIKGFPIFLESDIISFSQKISLDQKFDKNTLKGKLLLRTICKRLGIKHIDEKKGFSPALLLDWESNGKEIFKKFLLDKNAYVYKKNLINYNWLKNALHIVNDDGDIRYLNRLISILALEIWYRVEITREMKSSEKL
ncbi:MAG: asparagine synthase [Thaumarchaeota archaeon]|nr:MAG: asparagine synthase [Nitrososphaerota archaeon]